MIGLLFPPPEPAADLIVAGITVLERQTRQLRHAGVGRIIIVDPVPLQPLPAGTETRRSAELAAAVPADARVIILAPGLVIDERAIAAMLASEGAALLVSPGNGTAASGVERLDANTLATGIMLAPGEMVRGVAANIGDWDLHSTLLRTLAPEAMRIAFAALPLYAPARRRAVPMLWARPQDAAAAHAAGAAIIAAAQKGCLDWPARFLHPWPEDALVRLLAPTRVTPNMVTAATGVIGIIAGVAFALGWLWTGLVLALITGPLDGVDGKLARTRVEFSRWGDLEHLVDKLLEYGWYLALAWHFAVTRDSALPWAIATLIIVPAVAEAVQGEFFRRMTGAQLDDAGVTERRIRLVAGRRNTFLWTYLGFAAFGLWFQGFVMLAAYSVVTTAVAQWRFYKRLSAYGRDHGARIAANYAATGYTFLPPGPL
ncbi:MAG: hypothetical protein CFE37_11205 [Alphaproteobacteria bacterium PA4]|nr:MAG: hypothetical protein CFE37_11205 [Alphaproteobacteria bacterium PA4]